MTVTMTLTMTVIVTVTLTVTMTVTVTRVAHGQSIRPAQMSSCFLAVYVKYICTPHAILHGIPDSQESCLYFVFLDLIVLNK